MTARRYIANGKNFRRGTAERQKAKYQKLNTPEEANDACKKHINLSRSVILRDQQTIYFIPQRRIGLLSSRAAERRTTTSEAKLPFPQARYVRNSGKDIKKNLVLPRSFRFFRLLLAIVPQAGCTIASAIDGEEMEATDIREISA